MFPAGPGSDAINNNCIACHSADHVDEPAPSLSRAAWQEVVNKMITAYKAPVSADDARRSWIIWFASKAPPRHR